MKVFTRRKLLLLALIVTAASAMLLWWSGKPAQFVTLADGRQYRLAGVTWGTNHSQPRILAQIIDHLPRGAAGYLRKKLARRYGDLSPIHTDEPTLCVWFFDPRKAYLPTTWTSPGTLDPVILDGQGNQGGIHPYGDNVFSAGSINYTWFASNYCVISGFSMLPRRSRTLAIQVSASHASNGIVRFSNPLYGQYPQWKPEALPQTKQIDGLSFTVSNLSVMPVSFSVPVTTVDLSYRAILGSNEDWTVESVTLDDATGNQVGYLAWHPAGPFGLVGMPGVSTLLRASPYPFPTLTGCCIPGTLWPEEASWRLRIAMKRAGDDPEGQEITLTNIPVPVPFATNGMVLTQIIAGEKVAIQTFTSDLEIRRQLNIGNPRHILEMYSLEPNSHIALEFEEVLTDKGESLMEHASEFSKAGRRLLEIPPIPARVKSLTVKIWVQKLRVFDFYVKPPEVRNK